MLQVERLRSIERYLDERGLISITELEELIKASRATIYRDLKTMAAQGKVNYTRGGITTPNLDIKSEQPYAVKRVTNLNEKRRIARKACGLIKPNDTIFLDSSTTVFEMTQQLIFMKDIRVITNDILIAAELKDARDLQVFVIGGQLRQGFYTLSGVFAQQNLQGLQMAISFLGCDAISCHQGCMLTNIEEVDVKQKIMASSGKVVMLCDHSKFNEAAFIRFADVDRIDRLITGSELPEDVFAEFKDRNVAIERV